ncbi:MAG: DUF3109 family protein [Akkermansiaceae bacterium]|nr:DUF3109 family protein [Akkermansiaceae bacterium]
MSKKNTAYQKTAGILAAQLREAQVDHEAFEQRIKPCELANCRATCCHDGVYLSPEEAEGIEAILDQHGEKLAEYGLSLPTEPVVAVRGGKSWKTATRIVEDGELATDFPDHFPTTRCVFLDREGRCGIQRLSMELGRQPWFDKPLTCWIHPIVVMPANHSRSRPLLTLVAPDNDPQKTEGYPGFASCTHCGRPDEDGKKARQVLAAELEMLGEISGRDILGELNAQPSRTAL